MEKMKYSKVAELCYPRAFIATLPNWQVYFSGTTGKTTAHCLKLIATAMENPEITIPIEHECGAKGTSQQLLGSGGIVDKIERLLERLELQFFVVSRKHLTITYKPWGYLEKRWVEVNE